MLLRGIYTSDIVYNPKTLPSALHISPDQSYEWNWLPHAPQEFKEDGNQSLKQQSYSEIHVSTKKTELSQKSRQKRQPEVVRSPDEIPNVWLKKQHEFLQDRELVLTEVSLPS